MKRATICSGHLASSRPPEKPLRKSVAREGKEVKEKSSWKCPSCFCEQMFAPGRLYLGMPCPGCVIMANETACWKPRGEKFDANDGSPDVCKKYPTHLTHWYSQRRAWCLLYARFAGVLYIPPVAARTQALAPWASGSGVLSPG